MDQNIAVLLVVQGKPATPHCGGAVTHFNPEGGLLQVAPPRGRSYPDKNATIRDTIRTPGRGENCSGCTGTTHREGRISIGGEGIAYEGVDKVGNMGEGPRHTTVG